MNEVNRLKILQDVIDARLTTSLASQRLGITDRHCRRLLSRVRSESTFTYFEATRGYLEQHGKPLAFYSDKASVFRINNRNAAGGDGQTQFGRAMNEMNITGICANTSSAKGRVERAHLTLQDRLVKELRLRDISTPDAAKAFAAEFMADYNRRFAKAPRHDFDVHRPLDADDNLNQIFTWREPRKVSKALTVRYDKMLLLLEDNDESRRAMGKYLDAWQYPDGRVELRSHGTVLPYSAYDRLSEVDQGAIVDNKRVAKGLTGEQARILLAVLHFAHSDMHSSRSPRMSRQRRGLFCAPASG